MANSLVNELQAKRRFVESLTHYSRYGDNNNFLSPAEQSAQEPSPVIEAPKTVVKAPQSLKKPKEIQLTESEYQRIITLLESRRKKAENPAKSAKQESVPTWAKLAYASTNPNSERNQYY